MAEIDDNIADVKEHHPRIAVAFSTKKYSLIQARAAFKKLVDDGIMSMDSSPNDWKVLEDSEWRFCCFMDSIQIEKFDALELESIDLISR